MNACPVCESAVEGPPVDGALLACKSCGVRFLPAGATRVSVLSSAGDGAAAGCPELSAAFLARYVLGRVLGVGAQGTVYEARQRATGETVAVKFLKKLDRELLARFLREGELLRELAGPHVLRIIETGETEGFPFLVTELAAGGSLAAQAAAGALPVAQACGHVLDVLGGLAACHRRGVVHRDLKPANVLLDGAKRAKLADFGIARVDGADARLTATGMVLGTVAYMSPEQLAGETATPASDLYAAGMMLFELLAGRLPMMRTTIPDVVAFHGRQGPSGLARLAPETPAAVVEVVESALASDPAKRPAGAEQMAAALRRAAGLESRGRVAAPGPKAATAAEPAAALPASARMAIALALLTGVGAIFVLVRPRPAPRPAPSLANTPSVSPATVASAPSVSPATVASAPPASPATVAPSAAASRPSPAAPIPRSRTAAALIGVSPRAPSLGPIVRAAPASPSPPRGPMRVLATWAGRAHRMIADGIRFDEEPYVAVTADGRELVCATRAHARRMAIDSQTVGAPVTLPGPVRALSSSGDRALVLQPAGLAAVVDTRTGAVVSTLQASQIFCAQFAPGGDRVALGDTNGNVWLIDAATGARLWQATLHRTHVVRLSFSPDGTRVVSCPAPQTVKTRMTALAKTRRGAGALVIRTHADATPGELALPVVLDARSGAKVMELPGVLGSTIWSGWSTSGVIVTATIGEVFLHRADGTLLGSPPLPNPWLRALAFSADGARLAFSRGDQLQFMDLAKFQIETADETYLAARAFAFSPDGRWLAGVDGEGDALLWDARTGRPVIDHALRQRGVLELRPSPGGDYAIARDVLEKVTVWDTRTGTGRRVEDSPIKSDALACTVADDGTAAVMTRNSIRVHPAGQPSQLIQLLDMPDPHLALFTNGLFLLCASGNGYLEVTRSNGWRPTSSGPTYTGIPILGFVPDDLRMVTLANGRVRVAASMERPAVELEDGFTSPPALAFAPDSSALAVRSGAYASVFSLTDGKRLGAIRVRDAPGPFAVSPRAGWFAFTDGPRLELRRVRSTYSHARTHALRGNPGAMTFLPDGRLLASWADGSIDVCELREP
jgi:WD40 repeat protein